MDRSTRNILVGIILILVALGAYFFFHAKSSNQGTGESAARATVETFGEQMQKVSLLAPDASSTMATVYGAYVTPGLLASWESAPQSAPGRHTSSPWPDHIQVTTISQQGASYVVNGAVVLMTSTGLAGVVPVVLQVVPQNGTWLIAAYQEQSVPATTTPSQS